MRVSTPGEPSGTGSYAELPAFIRERLGRPRFPAEGARLPDWLQPQEFRTEKEERPKSVSDAPRDGATEKAGGRTSANPPGIPGTAATPIARVARGVASLTHQQQVLNLTVDGIHLTPASDGVNSLFRIFSRPAFLHFGQDSLDDLNVGPFQEPHGSVQLCADVFLNADLTDSTGSYPAFVRRTFHGNWVHGNHAPNYRVRKKYLQEVGRLFKTGETQCDTQTPPYG